MWTKTASRERQKAKNDERKICGSGRSPKKIKKKGSRDAEISTSSCFLVFSDFLEKKRFFDFFSDFSIQKASL
jgi:hypothetical protein